ncbi:MAG: hypothetical protein RUMPE_00796 [Eubacteriales bacterium SKADARSKE-1]|nr:hypothetical protein [Eubacteriales bacterium SKADARSKE-1]
MNKQTAWKRFKNTGKVLDYLNYIKLKNDCSVEFGEDKAYEIGCRRHNNNGEKHF